MIYTFSNKNASIVIMGKKELNRFEVLFSFFSCERISRENLRGILTKKNLKNNTRKVSRSLYTSYELPSRDNIKTMINFFYEK